MDRPRPGLMAALLLCLPVLLHAAGEPWLGRPLADYIDSLSLPVIYSSDVVPPGLRVAREPTASDPEYALRQVLAASGLALVSGPDDRLLVVSAQGRGTQSEAAVTGVVRAADGGRLGGAEIIIDGTGRGRTGQAGEFLIRDVAPGSHTLRVRLEGYLSAERELEIREGRVLVADILMPAAPRTLPDLVVTSSLHRLVYESPGSHTFLDRERLLDLPNLADDPLRAGERLPGVAGGGLSARAHVRGGEENETLVLFDGLRLYEPFHLKDFHNAVSMLDMQAVGGIDYYSGGFPARYGDRMSAVMDIRIRLHAGSRGVPPSAPSRRATANGWPPFGGATWTFCCRPPTRTSARPATSICCCTPSGTSARACDSPVTHSSPATRSVSATPETRRRRTPGTTTAISGSTWTGSRRRGSVPPPCCPRA